MIEPARGPAGARAGPRGGRHLPRHPRRPRGADAAGHRSRGLRGRARRSSASAPATGARSGATSWSSASACAPRTRPRRRRPASRSTTGSSSTSTCRRAPPACSRPATWRTPTTPSTASASASSTGPTRCTRDRSAARDMLGQPAALRPRCRTSSPTSTTSAWSTPGFARAWDRVVFRGDPAGREFIAFWLVEDRVVAGMNVNVWDVTDPIQALIRERVAVDDRRLADPDIPLDDLAPAEARKRSMTRLQTAARRRRLDLARHPLARAAGQRRLRDADRRLARSPAPPRTPPSSPRPSPARIATTTSSATPSRRASARPQELFFELALDDVAPRRRPAAARLRGERRPRRLRLLRVHARPRRRHRRPRSSRRSSCGSGSPGPT